MSVLLVVVFLVSLGFPIIAVFNMFAFPAEVWEAARRERFPWVMAAIGFGVIGAALYWFDVRRQLQRVEQELRTSN